MVLSIISTLAAIDFGDVVSFFLSEFFFGISISSFVKFKDLLSSSYSLSSTTSSSSFSSSSLSSLSPLEFSSSLEDLESDFVSFESSASELFPESSDVSCVFSDC